MRVLLAGLLLFASPAAAQGSAPYKLVIAWAQGGVAVIDYPNAARCEAARKIIDLEAKRRVAEAEAKGAERGWQTVGAPWIAYGFCIPG